MKKKFTLWMGRLGNGITVANSAVMEYGDYKMVAHISDGGNITWYVPVQSVPGDALTRIEHEANVLACEARRVIEYEADNRPGSLYMRMLDSLTMAEFQAHIDRHLKGLEANIAALMPLYLKKV